jgi:acetyl esterase/lipase
MLKATGCTITAPDYPLAPTYTYVDAFDMVVKLYKQMMQTNEAENMILMGDSAGGGFALALAQRLRDEHLPQPGKIILLSPWLDITLTNECIKSIDRIDPFLGIEGLLEAGKQYAGFASPDNYLLSPLYGSLKGLGKIFVFAGSNEILVADTRKLKSLAAMQQVDITYYEYPDMFHAWMLLNLPESKKTKQQLAALINSD